ncbi:MAG: hypothetical protein IT529_12830 [Burkholderiales bacterium]|nr:hypothetical protein [Burkholderiales bacterium]
MRILLALALLAVTGAACALETARALAQGGAPRLALARVEAQQPRGRDAPRWAEWEALRAVLLAALGRHADALQRAEELPADTPRPALREALLAASRAAVALGEGTAARRHAARVIWQLEPTREDLRAARRLVIDAYLAGRQGDPAFRSMLRFQQDYAPLDNETATRFVEGLLALDMARQAVNWLASLDEANPAKTLLRLKTGLIEPAAAVAQARAALARGGAAGYWRVIAEVARRGKDALALAEALEHLVNAEPGERAGGAAASASALWEAYSAAATSVASREKLPAGDDAAWADHAGRQLGSHPNVARALFAHLAAHGRESAARLNAQLQLVHALKEARLPRTALRLAEALRADDAALDPQARYLLGEMAEAIHDPAAAARYWKGLAPPPGVAAQDWRSRLAAAYWRAGMGDAALGELRALLQAKPALSAGVRERLVLLAREMVAGGRPELADEMLRGLLPHASAAEQRELLYALGRIAERESQPQLAAGYFLRAALTGAGDAPEAFAAQARLAAGLSLSRAGFREDARAQFEWVLRHAKDPARIETARRELGRL